MSSEGFGTDAPPTTSTSGVDERARVLSELSKLVSSPRETTVAEAEAWLVRVANAVGYTGSSRENLRVSLAYHCAMHTCSDSVNKDTPLVVVGARPSTHSVLVQSLPRDKTLREVATTAFASVIAVVLDAPSVRDVLIVRAVEMGLDAQQYKLALDFVSGSSLTPNEISLRSAAKRTALSRRNVAKATAVSNVVGRGGNASPEVLEPTVTGPVGTAQWA